MPSGSSPSRGVSGCSRQRQAPALRALALAVRAQIAGGKIALCEAAGQAGGRAGGRAGGGGGGGARVEERLFA